MNGNILYQLCAILYHLYANIAVTLYQLHAKSTSLY